MEFQNLAPELTTFLNLALEMTRHVFTTHGEAPPLILARAADGQMATVNLTGVRKNVVNRTIHNAKTIGAIVFITEAWMTYIEADEGSAIGKAMRGDLNDAIILEPRTILEHEHWGPWEEDANKSLTANKPIDTLHSSRKKRP